MPDTLPEEMMQIQKRRELLLHVCRARGDGDSPWSGCLTCQLRHCWRGWSGRAGGFSARREQLSLQGGGIGPWQVCRLADAELNCALSCSYLEGPKNLHPLGWGFTGEKTPMICAAHMLRKFMSSDGEDRFGCAWTNSFLTRHN